MATTREQFFKVLKDISAQLDRLERPSLIVHGGRRKTVVSTLALENLLTTLNTTLSLLLTAFNAEDFASETSLVAQGGVDSRTFSDIVNQLIGVNARTAETRDNVATGNIDLAAIEVLITAGNVDLAAIEVDLAAIEVLITAGNVDLAAMESLLTTIDLDTDAMATDLAAIETLLTTIDGDTSAINVDIAAIEILNTTSRDHLAAIESDTGPMQVDIAAIEVLLTTIDSVLDSMNSKLNTIDSIDYFLSGDTTDGGDLLNELQSIDQNWNILSVNQLNLAAILTAVLNNATSGRQDTMNTHLAAIETDTGEIAVDTAALEVLSIVNTKQITNHTWDFEVTETCSAAGTLIYAFQAASGDVFENFWMTYSVSAASGTMATILVTHTDAGGGRVLRRIDLQAGYSKTATVLIHLPNEKPNANQGHFDGRAVGVRIPFPNKIFITFTTPAINDIIQINCGAITKTASTPGDVKSGTGTFTQSAAVNDIRES